MPQTINPTVYQAAELMMDRTINDVVLRDVAAMRGLPLYVETAEPAGPSAADLAAKALRDAEGALRWMQNAWAVARADLGEANRRHEAPLFRGAKPQPRSIETVRRLQAQAMRRINVVRARLRAAERAVEAARAALLAVAS